MPGRTFFGSLRFHLEIVNCSDIIPRAVRLSLCTIILCLSAAFAQPARPVSDLVGMVTPALAVDRDDQRIADRLKLVQSQRAALGLDRRIPQNNGGGTRIGPRASGAQQLIPRAASTIRGANRHHSGTVRRLAGSDGRCVAGVHVRVSRTAGSQSFTAHNSSEQSLACADGHLGLPGRQGCLCREALLAQLQGRQPTRSRGGKIQSHGAALTLALAARYGIRWLVCRRRREWWRLGLSDPTRSSLSNQRLRRSFR